MAKSFPSRMYNFIVADDLRQETSGKISIIGAYSVGRILLNSDKLPAMLPLAFYIGFADGEGTFEGKFEIVDSAGKSLGETPVGLVTKKPDQGMQILVNVAPFTIRDWQEFKVRIWLDDHVYEDRFSVGINPDFKPA